MLLPSHVYGIEGFVVETMLHAEGKPCPPVFLGVGIGGTFDLAAALAKEALLLPVDTMTAFEEQICTSVNKNRDRADGARRGLHGPCSQGEDGRLPHGLAPGRRQCPVLGEPSCNSGGETVSTPPSSSTPRLARRSSALYAGDHVELSGIVYTARDEAHLRMREQGIPFDPKGAVIYHCGPVIQGGRVIAAGPTTSARMNQLSGFLIDKGVRGLIGKGGMGAMVKEQLRDKGVYFAFTGGCAALASSHMTLKGVLYEDLGMAEAIWVIELDRLPMVVGIDAHGNDIFEAARNHAAVAFGSYDSRSCTGRQ